MKQYGDGVGYRNPHEFEGDDISQQYLPDALVEQRYYVPRDQGDEATVSARMAVLDSARQAVREAGRQRRKQDRPGVDPMASMSDGLNAHNESRKRLAETQKRDAGT
jgi:hypothetical protein